jgi:hypothetical protein
MTSPVVETDSTVRWNFKISRDADGSVGSLLAQRGLKKGDLSKD